MMLKAWRFCSGIDLRAVVRVAPNPLSVPFAELAFLWMFESSCSPPICDDQHGLKNGAQNNNFVPGPHCSSRLTSYRWASNSSAHVSSDNGEETCDGMQVEEEHNAGSGNRYDDILVLITPSQMKSLKNRIDFRYFNGPDRHLVSSPP